ncbi:MAG: hypothetical protein GF347_00460 [Candidatus Moranbacteria bacterium]|nr:hypothetical protein [Candidatus Moranbacteria bacterium]
MKKTIYSMIVISLLIFTGCDNTFESKKPSTENSDYTKNEKCARKGEDAYTMEEFYSLDQNTQHHCCEGLKPMKGYGYNHETGECEKMTGPFMPCMPCGDGVCEFDANENICNCPQDCKKALKDCAQLNEPIWTKDSNIVIYSWFPEKCCEGLNPRYLFSKRINDYEWICVKETSEVPCAKIGQTINPPELKGKTEYADECCPGLKLVSYIRQKKDGSCEVEPINDICLACGDGICDGSGQWEENVCSCPQDCAKDE